MKTKHFEEDYNNLVKNKLAQNDRASAMAESIGGNFIHFGIFQRELLLQLNLNEEDTILDIGCGAGRLAYALKDMPGIKFIGIDVVQDFLDYAGEICKRSDWTFIKSVDFKIPLKNDAVDMVTGFSLFTHLLHEESFVYLAEARRVLKPGGKIVFSFLDFNVPDHWDVFLSNLLHFENRIHLNQFMGSDLIKIWSHRLHMDLEHIYPGNEPYIKLSEPVTIEGEGTFSGDVSLGQSVCVLQKPKNSINEILTSIPPGFDAENYLLLNPDVKKAGINAQVHYLSAGQFENRKWKT